MAFLSGLFGSPSKTKHFQRFTPGQIGLQNQAISQALGMLQNLPSQQFNFEPIAQQARTNFEQRTIPTIAERFTSMGGQGSSAFKQALGQAGAGLEENLAALQSQYGLQQQGLNQNLLNSLLSSGLTPSFESLYMPRTSGFLGNFLASGAQGAGSLLPLLLQLLGGR